jgi:hypothetical protein
MSVKLEWEIEDSETLLLDDGLQTETRSKVRRRWWRFFALLTLATIVGLGYLGFKIRQKHKEIENELRAVVEVELSAFVNGDRDLFLNQQDPDDEPWQRFQGEVFDNYHRQTQNAPWEQAPPAFEYTGQIPLVRVEGDTGWALVEVARGDLERRELWFYRQTSSAGWRRARLDEDWLGEEREISTPHLHFSYLSRDEAIVTALADEMEEWYQVLALLLNAAPSPNPELSIGFSYRRPTVSDALKLEWDRRRPRTLSAPSPHQSYLSTDESPTPELRQQMAAYLVEALMASQAKLQRPRGDLSVEAGALHDELRDWAVVRLARASSASDEWQSIPTPSINALVAREGEHVVPQLVTSLRGAETLDQVLATAGLDPPDEATRFAFLLMAAERAFYRHDINGYRALVNPQAWRQLYASQARWQSENSPPGDLWSAPSSLQIKSVVLNGETAWVEAESARFDGAVYRQAHFFRQVNGRWLLTAPDPAYLGQRRTARTENLVLGYFEPDALWFESSIPTELQALFSQAAADLGISTEGLVFTVTTELEPGIDGWFVEDANLLRLTSPSITGWPINRLDDPLLQMAFPLIGGLFQKALDDVPEDNSSYSLVLIGAFLWELDRLFPDRLDWDTLLLGANSKQVTALSLNDLWTEANSEPSEGAFERHLIGYRTLLEYLAETYGPQVVPQLLDNVLRTDDLDEWLRLSTGHGLDEIEPAWQEWVVATYAKQ